MPVKRTIRTTPRLELYCAQCVDLDTDGGAAVLERIAYALRDEDLGGQLAGVVDVMRDHAHHNPGHFPELVIGVAS